MQILVLKRCCMACAAHAMNKGHCNACTLKPAFSKILWYFSERYQTLKSNFELPPADGMVHMQESEKLPGI